MARQIKKCSASRALRKIDIFGHAVSLNHDDFESTRKTMCGGLCTCLLTCLMIAYIVVCAFRVENEEFTVYQSNDIYSDFEDNLPLKMNETDVTFIIEIK